MGLRTKLFLGLGGLFAILILISGTAIYEMNKLNNTIEEIVKLRFQKVKLVSNMQFEINNASRYLRDLILEGNNQNTDQDPYHRLEAANTEILATISTLEELVQTDGSKNLVADVKTIFDDYLIIEKRIYESIQSGRGDEAKSILYQDASVQTRLRLVQLLEEINTFQQEQMELAMAQSNEVYHNVVVFFALLVLASMILCGGIVMWLVWNIIGNLRQVTTAMRRVSTHEDKTSLPRLDIVSRDEIGEISEVFNAMVEALEKHARQEKETKLAIQEQHWLKSKSGEISALFQGVQEIKDFAQLVISRIPPMVGASYGVFYVSVGEGREQRLVKMASYASDGQEIGTSSFGAGEGLVGQCFLENKTIFLNDIPDQYIKVTSGLGTAPAKYINLVPVEFENKVIAVMELASFTGFSTLQQELLEQVRWNISIALNRVTHYMQVQQLLAESQALAEEMQTQSEELQMQQEELKTFNEKLENQYKVSEQKALELQKAKAAVEEQAHQLALSSQYKSEFLSNMSHELRTPLNSLLILAGLLVENKEGNLTPKQIEYGETILSAGNDLLILINDILDLARIEAGKINIKPEMISIDEFINNLSRQFQPVALQKSLEFAIQMENNLPKTFFTDGHKLMQILKNLLSNAFKFTEKGFVHLHVKGISESVLVFSVLDTGIGIERDKQGLIFQPFQQGDGTTSRKFGGTGLGLSICRELISLLGGNIELQSDIGKGSTFTIYLPTYGHVIHNFEPAKSEVAAGFEVIVKNGSELSKRIEPSGDNASQGQSYSLGDKPLKGHKVLVVDDDMRNVFAITAALEDQGIDVLFALNGREAQEVLLNNQNIDLVLMDIMMPEMDGFEAMHSIRQMHEYEELPIIALTAKAMKDDRNKCLQAGASDYISKPLDTNQLLSLMRVWLYRKVE
ncbi:response regulator [Desulfotomaculum defluvii]